MDKQFVFWLLTFIVGILAWFLSNLDRGDYNYPYFPNLRNKTTGELINLTELSNMTHVFDDPLDYRNSTDSDQRLYNLIAAVNVFSPISNDQYYRHEGDELIAGGPAANQTLCGQQLSWLIGNLIEHPNYSQLKGEIGDELNRLMDTYGRLQASTYRGNHLSIGSYSHCLEAKLQNGKIQNRYCLARFSMKSWPKDDRIYPPVTMSFGVCIPESCDSTSFGIHKDALEFLAKYHFTQQQKEQFVFESLFCLPDEKSELRQLKPISYILIYSILVWLSMILGASLLHEYYYRRGYKQNLANNSAIEMMTHKQQQETFISNNYEKPPFNDNNARNVDQEESTKIFQNLIEGIAIRHSIKIFKQCNFRIRYNRGERVRVDLSSIDFMKSLFIVLIVLGHGIIFTSMFAKNMRDRIDMTTGDTSRYTISIGRFVDTFFVFFGLLSTFTILRKFNLSQLSNPIIWTMANVGIYLRITPLIMLIYLFNRTIMPYTGSGPFWDYGIDGLALRASCRMENWIRIIPPFGAYGTPSVPSCNPPSWFLVSYSQIALLLPLLTYLLYRIPRTSYKILLITFLTLISALNVGYRLYIQRVVKSDMFTYYGGLMVALLDKYENSGYMDTLTRLGSVAFGCFVGYLLHLYSIGAIGKWPKWLTSKYFTFFNLLMHIIVYMLPVLGNRIYLYTRQIPSLETLVVCNMIAYAIWPILNGLLILTITTVYVKHVFVRFMSHPIWHVFNKLGLCILLVQYEVIIYCLTMFEHGPSNGFIIEAIKVGTFGLFFSIVISFMIYILFEAPITHVVMLMLGPLMLGKARTRLNEESNVTKTNLTDGTMPNSGQDNNNNSLNNDGLVRVER